MELFHFPEGLRLGAASAATQIDGDCRESSWYDWYEKGRIKDGSDPDVATRHRERMEEDTALMAGLGIRDYRFGLEWARLEPQEGQFSAEEFACVRKELLLLRDSGIRPLLTIHHFSNPLWFERSGAFLRPDAVAVFLRLVDHVVENLGDLVSEYITINEPNIYAVNGYHGGGFPPGENSFAKTLKVIRRLGQCHRGAYARIHALREKMGYTDTKVSFAHHMRAFAPMNPGSPRDRLCAVLSREIFQGHISRSYLRRGRYADFLAVNYYSRTASHGLCDGVFPGAPHNDLGWEIYPEGICECCRELHALAPELPIYITENGTADNRDRFRRLYLYDHLKALSESGLPVTRYYHWCFVDNFEWLEGFSARFGLVALDTATLARSVKKSGRFYAQMIAEHGVSAEMARELEGEQYPV